MTAPLRVAIDCRKEHDLGIGRYITGLVTALAALDELDLVLLTSRSSTLPETDRVRHIRTDQGHYEIREPWVIGRAIDAASVDLFHAPHYVFPAARTRGVVTIHDVIHLDDPRLAHRMYARFMLNRAVTRSEAILTVSQASASRILRHFPESAGRIVVTPNGVDGIWRSLDRKPEPDAVVVAGNDKPHKNLDRLVQAWVEVRRRRPGALLTIVGCEPERFRDVDGVAVRGFVDDATLQSLMQRATAVVSPSLVEGFGLPVAEAMAAGIPVAASDIEVYRELAGGASLLFDPLDPHAIATTIIRLLESEKLRLELAAKGRERSARFEWRAAAIETLRVYRRAAGDSGEIASKKY